MVNTKALFAKIEARRAEIENNWSGPADFHKFECGKTNGACPDDQGAFARLGIGAVNGMAADGQRFNQGELFECKLRRGMELAGGQKKEWAKPSIGMDAQHLERFAAIAIAAPASRALFAIDIGLDGAAVAWFYISDSRANSHHFDAQFMARDARVTVEGHFSQITGIVTAADADAMNADQGLVWFGLVRFRHFDLSEMKGLFELDGFHAG